MKLKGLLVVLLVLLWSLKQSYAIDFFFNPDTAQGQVGQFVTLSGRIGPTSAMRGFTVYMAYDTNVIDLSQPPTVGSLVAAVPGFQFNYFDHTIAPNLLEVGGTFFGGSGFWHGPGELFQIRFVLRQCALQSITAPFSAFFVDSAGSFPEITFSPAIVVVCNVPPQSVQQLTITCDPPSQVTLRWPRVSLDIFGNMLSQLPRYQIYREQFLPYAPPTLIATTQDTVYTEPLDPVLESLYYIITVPGP